MMMISSILYTLVQVLGQKTNILENTSWIEDCVEEDDNLFLPLL